MGVNALNKLDCSISQIVAEYKNCSGVKVNNWVNFLFLEGEFLFFSFQCQCV